MILAQYAADWITGPANSSGVPDIYVALSLHSATAISPPTASAF
jgi:hypothetical protein